MSRSLRRRTMYCTLPWSCGNHVIRTNSRHTAVGVVWVVRFAHKEGDQTIPEILGLQVVRWREGERKGERKQVRSEEKKERIVL